MTTRLTLLCHGATAATAEGRFPDDEPLLAGSDLDAGRVAGALRPVGRALTSPALAARQTAAHVSPEAVVDGMLADCDYGRWRGCSLTEIEAMDPAGLAAWMTDPDAAPHGGESLAALIQRVSAWLGLRATEGGRLLAVTHAAVMRAAVVAVLDAPPSAFWCIDVEPFGVIELTSNGARWALRARSPRFSVG